MRIGIIRFRPVYMDRVWGSNDPSDFPFGEVPSDNPVGEAWDISDRPNEQSFVRMDDRNVSFKMILKEHGRDIMGPSWNSFKRFPILVKRLFCSERLSLQVHPPKNVARDYGVSSKDEFWYVMNTKPSSQIFVGLKKGITREQFIKSLNENDIEHCVHRFTSRCGDAIFVPSGRLHAIDGGNVILEIQENSDTTFRVSDWGRMGLNGKPRELHVDQSLQSINFGDHEPHVVNTNMEHMVIANCEKFRIQQFAKTTRNEPLFFEKKIQPRILHVVEGHVKINDEEVVHKAESVILSYAGEFSIDTDEHAKFLITDNFFSN